MQVQRVFVQRVFVQRVFVQRVFVQRVFVQRVFVQRVFVLTVHKALQALHQGFDGAGQRPARLDDDLMVSWPESSWSSSLTLKQTLLMPPCSTLSWSQPSSQGTREGGRLASSVGGSPASLWSCVGSEAQAAFPVSATLAVHRAVAAVQAHLPALLLLLLVPIQARAAPGGSAHAGHTVLGAIQGVLAPKADAEGPASRGGALGVGDLHEVDVAVGGNKVHAAQRVRAAARLPEGGPRLVPQLQGELGETRGDTSLDLPELKLRHGHDSVALGDELAAVTNKEAVVAREGLQDLWTRETPDVALDAGRADVLVDDAVLQVDVIHRHADQWQLIGEGESAQPVKEIKTPDLGMIPPEDTRNRVPERVWKSQCWAEPRSNTWGSSDVDTSPGTAV
ncbi:hypothetical protein EYF80_015124 [Liparis tanakae]|uniref:Uncharacterized protein n=1 Tax=Liparis tanakae TaxID=230148 RepID=A0A4Z2I9G1_9TELE|nr:hypothetical protein EYF80_015124 [Liparis tanakae]